ncbi:DUF4132 domain-containing protein [Brachyspira pilosicoli]|uniref:DUF4132 domain-containing protein n=1 Tax=Brachyspira pilosicoli TaxID=52584 RepID=A0A5C8EWC9_BRAPL|nr:DUF4132 domain-containing protein [Brachyspira pilosicoli]TXJ41929.1 DUF4132 domain-containing protein [Brachyspira pilosicoli]
MEKIEYYIDYIFKENQEDIKQYVLKQTDTINFKINKNNISNDKNIYSKIVEKYFQKDDDNDYIIRLFKIISLYDIDNIYIFESFIINIISGLKIKDAILKTINYKKIINYNKGNISEEEILKKKFYIFIYFDNAYKYFPNYINNYIENTYKLTFEEAYKEYDDNIIIPLMALVIGYYFNNENEKYIDKILEYLDNINTIDSMLAVSIIIDKNKKIENKFLELLKQLEKNNKNLISDFIYISRLPMENKYFFDFNNYDDYINYLIDLNADNYIIFLIKYLNNNIHLNYSKIHSELIEIKKYDEETFTKIYEALKLSYNNKYAIELMSIFNLITNSDINNINYFLKSLEKELEEFFNIKHIKYNTIYDLIHALKIYKDDLTIKFNERIIFLLNVFNWFYESDDNAKKIVNAILESFPYNLMIPVIVKKNINLFNKNIDDIIKEYYINIKDLLIAYFNSYPIYIFKSQYITELLNKYAYNIKEAFEDIDFLNTVSNKSYALIDFLELVYSKNNFDDYSIVYNILNTDDEELKKYSLNIILENEELNRKYVEDNLDNCKEFKDILKKWNYSKEDFCFNSIEEIYDYVDYYYTDNELLDFLDNNSYYNILSNENTNIDIKVLKYILNEFLKIDKPKKIKDVEKILEFVERKSFIDAAEKAAEYFINNNLIEDNIKIITPYAIYADESHIEKLHQLLIDWNNSFKTSLILYTMQSIAINGKTSALKMINKFALNSNNKEIKNNIKDILVYASEILNTNIDNIFERLFPNFGFDAEGKKIINYGNRSFQLQLLSDSYLEIFDIQNSSIIKELPETDGDKELEKVKEDFLHTQKTLKEIINYEKIKLTRALINGRKWDYKTFFEVFINNPIMHYFTLSFVWGVYDENDVLIDSFRYMEDGAFVTIDDELYELPNNCYIGIYNIIDDDIEKFYKWKEQFELYDIEQPINQFMNELITLKEENVKYDSIIMFEGIKIDTSYINQLCRELDIRDTYFNDNASYMIFDDILKTVCKINAYAYGEEIVLGSIEFYELEKNERLGKKINPFEISQKFVSSILYYLSLGLYE